MTEAPTPDSLRVGSLVGPWRVEGYAGCGAYGVVYRARRAGHPGSMPVALKIALFAADRRFEREAGLLARFQHPAMPRLLDRGLWHASRELMHPYFAMEWIRGRPLYDWARQHPPSSRQVLQVVAQVAWGLEVLHRAGCLHRDIKGDNLLVEPEGRAVITDFGSGTWAGAAPLTERLMAPGTREYRSPEALWFEWEHWEDKKARYEARPADDIYALGASVYRLLTGVYPPPPVDPEELKGLPVVPPPPRVPPREMNERVVPELAALVERMLARQPEARGTGRELAEAAESAAEHLGSHGDVPLSGFERPAAAPRLALPQAIVERPRAVERPPVVERPRVEAVVVPAHVRSEPRAPSHGLGGVAAAAFIALVMAIAWWIGDEPREGSPVMAQAEAPDAGMALDAGTTGLGDGMVTARVESQEVTIAPEAISLDMPTKPLPGQRRPPCKRSGEVIISGGCWKRLANIEPPCDDDEYEWQGACYRPALERTRRPTSNQQK